MDRRQMWEPHHTDLPIRNVWRDKMFKQYKLKDYRFRLVVYVVILTIIGIFVVGSAQKSLQDNQIMGLFAGLVVMVIASLIDYSFLLKFRRIF